MLVFINVSEQICFFFHRIEGAALKNLLITASLNSSSKMFFFETIYNNDQNKKMFSGIKFATKMS